MAFIYLLINESMPNVVKVGYTNKSVEERAVELYSTGVPTPFIIFAHWKVSGDKVQTIEAGLHRELSRYRISNNREFFKIEPKKAKFFISNFIGNCSNNEEDCQILATRKNIEKLKKEKIEEEYKKEKNQIYSAYCALKNKRYEITEISFEQARKNIGVSEGELIFNMKSKYQKINPLISIPITVLTLGIFPPIMNAIGNRCKETEEQKEARERLNKEKIACLAKRIVIHFNEYNLECNADCYESFYTNFYFKKHYISLLLDSRFGIEQHDSHKHIHRK